MEFLAIALFVIILGFALVLAMLIVIWRTVMDQRAKIEAIGLQLKTSLADSNKTHQELVEFKQQTTNDLAALNETLNQLVENLAKALGVPDMPEPTPIPTATAQTQASGAPGDKKTSSVSLHGIGQGHSAPKPGTPRKNK